MIHGDPNISGVQEERQDKWPQCAWPVKKTVDTQAGQVVGPRPCGSEEGVFNVKGSDQYTSRPRETPVCGKQLPEAWKAWRVDSTEPT